jgi:CheY-like chemotaxis protein
MINLTNNAVKFTHKGHVRLAVESLLIDNEQWIRLDVEDTGIGIKPEDMKKIFDSFSQADGSTTRKYGGTGLGLSITQKMSYLMGGKVEVKSKYGKGSVFSIVLPVFSTTLKDPKNRRQKTVDDKSCMSPKENKFQGHVLVAEDAEDNLLLIKTLLEKTGLKVTAVSDGLQAIEAAQKDSYDLILLDIKMPEKDGFDVLRQMRTELGIETPAVAITAKARPEDMQECTDAGFCGYIPKPIKRDHLHSLLAQYLKPIEVRCP